MANKFEEEMESAMKSKYDYPSPAELEFYVRRARHARSEAFAETGRWLITRIRAAFDALFHAHPAAPHGPKAA